MILTLLECCAGRGNPRLLPPVERADTTPLPLANLADARGHAHARRALEVAAGSPHVLLIGSPGCGKNWPRACPACCGTPRRQRLSRWPRLPQ
ncbi:ATP-binding protein [Stenotrophomonas indicatrix]|uniref:ATP-binding protein n=1 Tax=Stenotrophomonas indicatrix TaxID=2045451 RepID=UPI00289F6F9C|nr:ATP-binding protein [Stenotrophomonas indicatrix]